MFLPIRLVKMKGYEHLLHERVGEFGTLTRSREMQIEVIISIYIQQIGKSEKDQKHPLLAGMWGRRVMSQSTVGT